MHSRIGADDRVPKRIRRADSRNVCSRGDAFGWDVVAIGFARRRRFAGGLSGRALPGVRRGKRVFGGTSRVGENAFSSSFGRVVGRAMRARPAETLPEGAIPRAADLP